MFRRFGLLCVVATVLTSKGETSAEANVGSEEEETVSVLGLISNVWGFGVDLGRHALSKTDLDERIAATASSAYDSCKTAVSSGMESVSAMNYSGMVQGLQSHPMYANNVAQHVDTMAAAAQPHLDKAKPHIDMIKEKAQPHLDTASKIVSDVRSTVSNGLSVATSKAYDAPQQLKDIYRKADDMGKAALDPLFNLLSNVSERAKKLPKGTLDRILLIGATLYLIVKSLLICFTLVSIVLYVALFGLKSLCKLVLLPFKLMMKIFWFNFWICTCFHCCGFCSRRKTKAAPDEKGSKKSSGSDKEDKAAAVVTVSDLTGLLEQSKKENKLEAAAKQLASFVKNGKSLSAPKHVAGKKVTKDVFLKTCKSFKEIDVQKLKL